MIMPSQHLSMNSLQRCCAVLLFGLTQAANALELAEHDWERLHRGEVVVQSESVNDQNRVAAAIIIHQPVEKIWQVMLDCEHIHEFVPNLEACTLLDAATDGSWQLLQHEVSYGWLAPDTEYIFRADYDIHRNIHFERISGDLNELEGDWSMQVMGDFVLVTYSVFIDPGFIVPGFMTRSALRHDIPELMHALRQRVAFVAVVSAE